MRKTVSLETSGLEEEYSGRVAYDHAAPSPPNRKRYPVPRIASLPSSNRKQSR